MREKALHVLLVEDNAGDARLLREMFRKEKPGSFELTHLARMGEALAYLEKGGADIVLLDMGLPDGHGIETVRRARRAAPGVPIIVLTGLDDEALAAEAMKEGVQDYLIKGQIENRALPRALRYAIERHNMQTENDQIRTQQMQLKDEFLSHVSHELRSPLTAVYLFVTNLLDGLDGGLNPQQRESLETVLRNVKQLQSMIHDLLEVARVQAGKLMIEPQCTYVSDAIEYTIDTLQVAAIAKGIALSSDVPNSLPPACADPTRLRQILVILVDNAIKFTPAGGMVKIQARMFDEDPNRLVLEVSDTGCGIAPDMAERVFERLVQTSDTGPMGRKGLGLGLHICKELVTRHGGQISVKSAPGQGAAFSFTLPIFSLPNLIAPSLTKDRRAEGLVTLVVAEIASNTGWLSEEVRAEQSLRVRAILQRCLHSELDILLPRLDFSGAAELFFIVAITDDIGGEAITKRIRQQLDGCKLLQRAGLVFSISYRSLDPIPRIATEPNEVFLEKVSAKVQELMNEEISARMVTHAQ